MEVGIGTGQGAGIGTGMGNRDVYRNWDRPMYMYGNMHWHS